MRFGFSNTSAASALTRVINITSNVNNYNLYNALLTTGWDGTKRLKAFITINNGVTVGSTSASTPAFLVNLKDTDYVEIINNGNIFGAGGAGGGSAANSNGSPGEVGGTALQALSNVRVVNNGIIGGGGGGNGGDGAYRRFLYYVASCPQYNANLEPGYFTCGRCRYNMVQIYPATCTPVYDYPASSAGASGVAGSGAAGAAGASPWYAGGSGGSAGAYYQGSNKITIITAGTVRGTLIQ